MGMKNHTHGLCALCLLAGAAVAAVAIVGTASATLAHGDDHPIAPMGELVPRRMDSGWQVNRGDQMAVVYSDLVATADAIWTRLYFAEIVLEGDSRIRFTSLFDGEVQELDADGVAMWNKTSAYFNGSMVLVELLAAPDTTQNRFMLEEIGVDYSEFPLSNHCSPPLECGLCNGTDDRVPSDENWACRLLSAGGGCSAAIYNEHSCVVSAGHCMGNDMVIQFNVPLSNPNCSINHPPIEDQFPITSQISQNSGVGADWAVMTSGTNTLGQTAYERFGEYRPIATSVPSSGPSEVWGYGVTDECTLRQTQQYSFGNIIDLTSNAVYYTADVTCGNSGSSILQNGEIIGIVTHCTFTCPPNGNIGTRIDVPAFVSARDTLCGEPEDVTVPTDYPTIQQAINSVGSGSVITVLPGTYSEAINFNGKNLTVISSDGPEVTTIDATGQNASVARFSNNETSQAVLEGFTLAGGTGSNVTIGGTQYVLGGGVYAGGSSPTIRNCIIVGNTAQFGGGVFNNNASPTFEDCVFDSNTSNPSSGGGAFNFNSTGPTYINTLFVNNTATVNGGGMSSQNSSPIVTDCLFINNSASGDGGAVRNIQGSSGQFTNCTFEFNSAGNGGAFFNNDSSGTMIADSTFCENDPNNITGSYTDGDGNEFLDECDADTCPWDFNGDGVVDGADLGQLLANWGTCSDCDDCPWDVTGDCEVDGADLGQLLANWGECP